MNTDYEKICAEYSNGYHSSGSTVMGAGSIRSFFHGKTWETKVPNHQSLDLDGLMARYSSASYSLGKDHHEYPAAISALKTAFNRHSSDGAVTIQYETKIIAGHL